MTRFFCISFGAILAMAEVVCADQETVTIGVLAPLTGDVAAYGTEMKNAVDLAAGEINASDYLPGKKLEVVYEDSKCNGKDASAAAQKLVGMDRVKAIVGGACSSETLAAAPVTEKAKVILLAPFSSNPNISQAGDYVFRNCVNDADGGREAASLVKKGGFKRPAAISENSDYALGLERAFVDTLKKEGLTLVAEETFDPAEYDFKSLLLRLAKKSPDIIFVNPQGGLKGGLLVKQLREMKLSPKVIGTFVFSSQEAHSAAGGIEQLEGLLFVDAPPITTPRGRDVIEKYKRLYSKPVQAEFLIAFTYDAVYLIADAIKAVSLDTDKMRDYFYNLPLFKGVGYDYRFDRNGDMVGVPYAVKQIRNGKVETMPR